MEARRWLDRFRAPMAYEGVARINGRIDVFALTGALGQGLLAEAWHHVEGRPGVNRVQTSAWVIRAGLGSAFVMEIELHSWDAGTEAMISGDHHWLEVPRRRMYAERDRRTAAVGEELDTFTVYPVPIDWVPGMLAGLSPDQVQRLAERFQPGLLIVQSATQPVERSQPTCPECGKGDPLRIAYGYPGFDMFEAEQRGELLLGGCEIEPDSPTWACRDCRHKWAGPPSRIDGLAAIVHEGPE